MIQYAVILDFNNRYHYKRIKQLKVGYRISVL